MQQTFSGAPPSWGAQASPGTRGQGALTLREARRA